jgi:hypothetical protein
LAGYVAFHLKSEAWSTNERIDKGRDKFPTKAFPGGMESPARLSRKLPLRSFMMACRLLKAGRR